MHNPNICMQQIIAEGITALMTIIIIEYELIGSQPVSHSQTPNLKLASHVVAYLSLYIGSKGSTLGMHEL